MHAKQRGAPWGSAARVFTPALLALALLWAAPTTHAATLTVTSSADSGSGTLRAAVAAANVGDTIVFSGVSTVTLTSGEITLTKPVTIVGDGVTVSAGGASRVFEVAGGPTTLSGLTITQGHASNGPSTPYNGSTGSNGGGILVDANATVSLSGCTLTGNSAGNGGSGAQGAGGQEGGEGGDGAVFIGSPGYPGGDGGAGGGVYVSEGASVTLSGCTLTANTGGTGGGGGGGADVSSYGTGTFDGGNGGGGGQGGPGGGLYVSEGASVTLSGCTLTANTGGTGGSGGGGGSAMAPSGYSNPGNPGSDGFSGDGGGVYSSGAVTLSGCTLTGSNANLGGALYNDNGGMATLTNCDLSNNSDQGGEGGGGAVFNAGGGTVTLTRCRVSHNQDNANSAYGSGGGGGICNQGVATLTACILSNNISGNSQAVFQGGGGFYNSGQAMLNECTLSGNSASLGSAIENYGGTMTLTNDILYGDNSGEVAVLSGSVSVSHCDIQGGVPRSATDGGGNLSADPLFVRAPGTNGSADPGNLHLQAGSPCIGAGTGSAPDNAPFDFDGAPRSNPPTIGAYEGQPATTGTTTSTTLASSQNPSTVGQNVTFTATVANTNQGSGAIPAGTVTFSVDSSSVATVALDGNGQATYSTSSLMAGSHTASATFAANVRFQGSTSNPFSQSVVAAPTANDQSISVAFNTAKEITLTGSDPNSPSRPLTYIVVSSPSHGTLSGTAPNLTYTPAPGYQGSDRFTFKVNNGTLDSNTATVSLTVAAGMPTATPQSVSVAHDTAKSLTLTGTDPDNPPLALTYTVTTNPLHGTLSGTAPNLTYTPSAGYQGADSFTFTVSNGTNTSPPATVTLTVAAGVPTANPQTVATSTNTAKQITLTGTDPDVPGLPLTYSIGTGPAHGTLTGLNPSTGAVTYTPAAGYFGTDTFTFTVRNGTNTSPPATVTITVTDATPPVVTASADKSSLWPPNGKSVPVTITGKVTDAGSGPASTGSYTVTDSEGTRIPGGTFTIQADGTYSFTLNLTASRNSGDKDGRTYTVTVSARDKAGNVGTATVLVTVPHDQGS